jgi:hypothetical protein
MSADQLPLPTDMPVRERLAAHIVCRRCHRALHDPLSRLLRIGPECRRPDRAVRRCEVEQEELPGLSGGGCPEKMPDAT